MFIRASIFSTLTTFLLFGGIAHAMHPIDDDSAGKARTFTWDTAEKAETDRIFALKSPSADELENIFCAVHITGVNPVDRNYVLTPGSSHSPFGLGSRFVQLGNDSFRPFVYFTLGDTIQDHEKGKWSEKKYAIITRFSNLVGRSLNISPLDTAVLGDVDLKALPGSIIFLPQSQRDKIKSFPENLTLIGYADQSGIMDVVKAYLSSKQHMILKEQEGHFSFGQKVLVGSKDIYTPEFFRGLLTRYKAASFGQEAAPKLARGMHNFVFLARMLSTARRFYIDRLKLNGRDPNNFNFGKLFQLQPLVTCSELAMEKCDALVGELAEEAKNSGDAFRIDQLPSVLRVYQEHRNRVTTMLRTMRLDVRARTLFQIILTDIGTFIEPRRLDSYCDFDGNGPIAWDDEGTKMEFLKELARNYSYVKFHFDATNEPGFFPFETVLSMIEHSPFSDVKRIVKNKDFSAYELELKAAVAFRQELRKLYGQEAIDDTNLIEELKSCYKDLREKYFLSNNGSKYYAFDSNNLKAANFPRSGTLFYLPLECGHMGLVHLLTTLSCGFLECKGDVNRRHSDEQIKKLRSFLTATGFQHLLTQFEIVGFVTRDLENYRAFTIQNNLSDVLDHNGGQVFPATLWKKSRSYMIQVESLGDPWGE